MLHLRADVQLHPRCINSRRGRRRRADAAAVEPTHGMLRLALSLLSTSAAAYTLSFQTDVAAGAPRGLVVINVTAAWAPLGAAHLRELVEDGFYDVSCPISSSNSELRARRPRT